MKSLFQLMMFVSAFVLISCGQAKTDESKQPGQQETRQVAEQTATPSEPKKNVSLYIGMLPCADCQGIRVELLLYNDTKKLRYSEQYIGSSDEQVINYEGVFSEFTEDNMSKLKIELTDGNDKVRFFAKTKNNELIPLDKYGNTDNKLLNFSLKQEVIE